MLRMPTISSPHHNQSPPARESPSSTESEKSLRPFAARQTAMPTKCTWKDFKNAGPIKVGVFEKMNWHKGEETDSTSVSSSR